MDSMKPVARLRVYDLLKEAGLDVSDWAKYRRPKSPASNPKYCYNWAFVGRDRVVLCLWHKDMRRDDDGVFQRLNYRNEPEHWTSPQRKRAREMDRAFRLAKDQNLPIRVVVVDGHVGGNAASSVKHRLLDATPWFVASYDDDGDCRLQRGEPAPGAVTGNRRLARIAYNSSGWQRPTGEAADQEANDTYNSKNRFGHEDWLFRAEWVVDGWRYSFIQGLNKGRNACLGQTLDLTLFTIQPDKRQRLIATIYGLEALSDQQAKEAMDVFQTRGWLKTMEDEVRAIGGDETALGNPQWAEHVLNVRYRLENVDRYPKETLLPEDDWSRNRLRYQLYKFDAGDQTRVERSIPTRRGRQDTPKTRLLFRRGTKSVEYTPEHDRMQSQLMAELKREYGTNHVWREHDFVDVRVETEGQLIYFEIKTDLEPRAVLRQALGQILEYAYHPARTGRRPDKLVIVGRSTLGQTDEAYFRDLCVTFSLPLSYRVVAI